MKKILAALFVCAFTRLTFAAPPAPYPLIVDSQAPSVDGLLLFQASPRTIRVTFRDGLTNASNITGTSPFLNWFVSRFSTNIVTSSWAIVNGTGGVADFTFSAGALNTNGGPFGYEVGLTDTNGTTSVTKQGVLTIRRSPTTAGAGSIEFTTNQNWALINWINLPNWSTSGDVSYGTGFSYSVVSNHATITIPTVSGSGSGTHTNLISSNTIITVTQGSSAQPVLNVSTSALASALASTFATSGALYAETDAAALGQLSVASNALRVSVGLLTTQLVANGAEDTNNANAILAASNTLAARIGVVEGYTNRAAAGLASSVWALAESTTGYYRRVDGNLLDARLVVVEGYTSRVVGVEAYTSRIVAVEAYTNRSALALASSVWANAASTTDATSRVTFNSTTNILQQQITSNLTSQTTTDAQLGMTDTNLNGRIDTNYTELGLARTNIAQVGFVASNALDKVGLVNTQLVTAGAFSTSTYAYAGSILTQVIYNGLLDTNESGRITTNYTELGLARTNITQVGLFASNNLVLQGLLVTQLVRNGLTDTNLAGLVASNWVANGVDVTNLIKLGLRVTNNLILIGALQTQMVSVSTTDLSQWDWIGTNGIWISNLYVSAASKTSRNVQAFSSGLQSLGSIHANTNLVAANTNGTLGGELISNGGFAGSADGWLLNSASWDAGNKVYVAPGASATIIYTNGTVQPNATYLLSFVVDIDTGTNPTTFKASACGFTNYYPYISDATYTMILAGSLTQHVRFDIAGGTNTVFLDTVSLKQVREGDAWVARNIYAGNDVSATGNVTVGGSIYARGSITGSSVSANSYTGLLVTATNLITDTITGASTGGTLSLVAPDRPGGSGAGGGHIVIQAGRGGYGAGNVFIVGGYGQAATGGTVILRGGNSGTSQLGGDVWLHPGTGAAGDGSVKILSSASNVIVTVVSNGVTLAMGAYSGNGSGLTNIDAAGLQPGSVLPAVDGHSITGVVASGTATVSAIVIGPSNLIGNVSLSNSTTVSWSVAGGGAQAAVVAGSINGSHIADSSISNSEVATRSISGTKIVLTNAPLAASAMAVMSSDGGSNLYLGSVSGSSTNTFTGGSTTGAVVGAGTDTNKYLSQNGTWEADKIGIATGNLFSVASDSALIVVSNASGPVAMLHLVGVATGTPVQVIDAGANITVTRTGDTVNIVGSAGGGGTTTNVIFENLDGNGDVGAATNQVARGSWGVSSFSPTNGPPGIYRDAAGVAWVGTNDATGAGGGGDVYTTSNNTFAAGKVNTFPDGIRVGTSVVFQITTDSDDAGVEDWNFRIRPLSGIENEIEFGPSIVAWTATTYEVANWLNSHPDPSNHVALGPYYAQNLPAGGLSNKVWGFTTAQIGTGSVVDMSFQVDNGAQDMPVEVMRLTTNGNIFSQGGLFVGTNQALATKGSYMIAAGPVRGNPDPEFSMLVPAGEFGKFSFRDNANAIGSQAENFGILYCSPGYSPPFTNACLFQSLTGGRFLWRITGNGSFPLAMVLDNSGNVGIGWTNISERLEVNGNLFLRGGIIKITDPNSGVTTTQPRFLGVFTNKNPTQVVPAYPGDYFMDAGSNTVVVSMDGTTNGWRWTPLNAF